jgi:peptidoglycan hydrolase-like protein with peptidoglycan-binding domain
MRKFLFLLLILLPLGFGPAHADFDGSRAWFEARSETERTRIQTDLILLGHYTYLVDGQFGRGTFEALTAFQKGEKLGASGVLSDAVLSRLRLKAQEVEMRLGLDYVSDDNARLGLVLPTALLTERRPTADGTSFASADGEISLETMHTSLAETSFEDLYASVTAADPERRVTYKSFSNERFVVTGEIGGYSYYTLFLRDGTEAVGYSLAWGPQYAEEGSVTAVFLASHISPLSLLPPTPAVEKASAPSPADFGDFVLPPDHPEIIALNAEITGETPAAMMAALSERPDARIVVLNSPGGGVDSALEMAREIRKRGLATVVPAEMGCYSACAYMFFAGEVREAVGELGVHQIYAEVADLVLAQTTLGDVLDALEEYGVEQAVISRMLRTPPEDMYVFTADEIAEFSINRGGSLALAAFELPGVGELEPSQNNVDSNDPGAGQANVPGVPETPPPADGGAFVHLASLVSQAEADRSLDYLGTRWASVLGETRPEIASDGAVFRVRVPVPSVERGNAICAAIHSDGGGCYVEAAGAAGNG